MEGQEVPIATDGRTDPQLHRWLASKIDGALTDPDEDGAPTPRGDARDEEVPTHPGAPRRTSTAPPTQSPPPSLGRAVPLWLADDEADPETVRAGGFLDEGSLEDEPDAATVRMNRLPVSFIGESVIDPATAVDHRPEATAWREGSMARAFPRVPARHPPREPVRVPLTPAPEFDPDPTAEPLPVEQNRVAVAIGALAVMILTSAVAIRFLL